MIISSSKQNKQKPTTNPQSKQTNKKKIATPIILHLLTFCIVYFDKPNFDKGEILSASLTATATVPT